MKGVDLCSTARTVFQRALNDCGIERAVADRIKASQSEKGGLRIGEFDLDFSQIELIRVIAIGKASRTMLQAMLPRLPAASQCDLAGVLIGPDLPSSALSLPPRFESFAGGHPFPNTASLGGAQAVLDLLQSLPPGASPVDTLCLFLISGGASAMMELPLDAAIGLEDTVAFHRILVNSGASITEINCVRKHFSAVKGGRLALAAKGANRVTILVSDVPDGRLDTISSGPTLPDSSTVEECREILSRYKLLPRFPSSVRRFFASSEMPETVKPAELPDKTWTLLSSKDLANSARLRAQELGFYTVIDNTCDDWDYRAAADYLLNRLRELRREQPRVCLISVGEITVQSDGVSGHAEAIDSGVGGRNQHFALHTATLFGDDDVQLAVLSAGSDGIDGNSAAAGAVVNEHTLRGPKGVRSLRLRDAEQALRGFHSSRFLESLNATIVTGPTGNNLRDLRILLADNMR